MRQWTIDAFAPRAFLGNPACVVEPQDHWPEAQWMQALAAENNQAETAFLLKTSEPDQFHLRWFTPATEVPLCGHATLASAHVLFSELGLVAPKVTFETRSGPLHVRKTETGYEMDFPAGTSREVPCPAGFAEALGEVPSKVFAGPYLIAVYDHADQVRALRPNLEALKTAGAELGCDPGNIGVVAPSDDPAFDLIDRFFGPGVGIPEDPATGSLHSQLGPLFAGLLGKQTLRFLQAYPGRGGHIETQHQGERVLLRGQAVTTVESRLRLS